MKLGRRQLALLLEALRRFTRFGKPEGKELLTAWTGLGTNSEYATCHNAGLMTYVDGANPRYSTWWKLTEKGAKIVRHFLDKGYGHKNVENGWDIREIHYSHKMGICPESFFPEVGNRATFDFERGEFVWDE